MKERLSATEEVQNEACCVSPVTEIAIQISAHCYRIEIQISAQFYRTLRHRRRSHINALVFGERQQERVG